MSIPDEELRITYENSNVEDQSGNGRDGTILGMTFETIDPLVDLVSGLYPGSADFVNFGEILPFAADQPWTLAKWFKVSDKTQFQPLIARSNSTQQTGYILAISGFNNVGEIITGFGTNISNRLLKRSLTLIDNDEVGFALTTYDGSKTIEGFNIYLNNVDAGNGGTIDLGAVTDPNYSGINLRMGARQGDAASFSLDGLGDNGCIYSRVLNAAERTQLFREGAPRGGRRRRMLMGRP